MSDPAVDAERMKGAITAVMDTLEKCGVADDATICIGIMGCLVGCIVTATNNPEQSLASVNAAARGIMDGSLLD